MDDFWSALRERVSPPMVDDVAAIVRLHGPIRTYFIRPETVFDRDSVFDATAIFLLTDSHLIVVLSDVTYEFVPVGEFVTTTQVIPLKEIHDYQVIRRRVLDGPESGAIASVQMRLRWGANRTLDIRPASCDDPTCEAEHGFIGMSAGEDGDVLLDATLDDKTFAEGLAFIDELAMMLAARA